MFVDAVHQKAVVFGWFLHKIMIPADTQLKEVKPGLQRLKEGSASVQLLWQPGQASVSYLMTLPACPSCSFDFSYNEGIPGGIVFSHQARKIMHLTPSFHVSWGILKSFDHLCDFLHRIIMPF